MQENDDIIYIFTDGSAKIEEMTENGAIGPGGIGIFLKYRNYEKKISLGYKNTRTGRMEIKAIIVALNEIKDKTKKIVIISDSQYVIKSITIYMTSWIHKGWLGVKNVDLWKQFLQIYDTFDKSKITFQHVKGHTGLNDFNSCGNAIVDELASYKNQTVVLENDLMLSY